ncbi:LacI family DNA-binding transcriptional regulator [Cellulomonas sp. P5_E12]
MSRDIANAGPGAKRADRPVVAMDVARAAGVSPKTVSRAVNGDSLVSDNVRGRVRHAIATLDDRPNRTARDLDPGRSRTIGVLSVGPIEFGPSSFLVAAEHAVRGARYAMSVISTAADEPERIAWALGELVDQGVDGIVMNEPVGLYNLAPGEVGELPVLSVSGSYGISSNEIVVDADQYSGARVATAHLLALGHRTVRHLGGPFGWRSTGLRQQGWRDALTEAGAEVPAPLHGDWTAQSGYDLGVQLAADRSMTAVFVANDQMAFGLLRALAEAGRNVPAEVSVVGFDDIPEASYLTTALTTVRQNLAHVATLGVGLLIDAIENPRLQDRSEIVPVELIVRETTSAPPPGR